MEHINRSQNLLVAKRQHFVLFALSVLSFLLIFTRLIFLQLINHESYKKMSDENRIRLIASQPIRGRIIDKNGFILADSRLKYSLIIKPQYIRNGEWNESKLKISNLLGLRPDLLQKKYSDGLKRKDFVITLINDLNTDQLIKFKENENTFSGFEIATKLIRNYPYKTVAAHVVGYTQPITDSEYKFLSSKGYKLNDLIGRTGIEAVYEDLIRGEWGGDDWQSIGNFQNL